MRLSIREIIIVSRIRQNIGKWDMKTLSFNKAITHPIIEELNECRWEWRFLSDNHNIIVDRIPKNVYNDIDWFFLSQNPSITIDFVVKNIQRGWYWMSLSSHPNISFDDIMKFSYLSWSWPTIYLFHANEENMNKYPSIPWYTREKSLDDIDTIFEETFSKIQCEFVNDTDFKLFWRQYSQIVSLNIIEKYIDAPWSIDELCKNSHLTLDFIITYYIRFKWNFNILSTNINLCIDDIIRLKHLPWEWERVSAHPRLCIQHILQCPTIPWNIKKFCMYGTIEYDDIRKYPLFPWDWKFLGFNNNIFNIQDKYIYAYIQKQISACKIQRAWFRCNTNPEYAVCKKRLMKEYMKMVY